MEDEEEEVQGIHSDGKIFHVPQDFFNFFLIIFRHIC